MCDQRCRISQQRSIIAMKTIRTVRWDAALHENIDISG
ncbi:putative iS2 ORF2 [Escherichia coli 2-011-08_S3_C3]|nr:putative iS2 ORF2 [Escherichia coli 2-011-08_S3_C3]KDS99771.1 putative iS2 ORF2 [Escherichia coli 2-011-08_S3_C1]KEM74195.1 putative iS2 ORF2 [Escherichia coli 7-233-03_S3_C1]